MLIGHGHNKTGTSILHTDPTWDRRVESDPIQTLLATSEEFNCYETILSLTDAKP